MLLNEVNDGLFFVVVFCCESNLLLSTRVSHLERTGTILVSIAKKRTPVTQQ
jgi:hypothetical protein